MFPDRKLMYFISRRIIPCFIYLVYLKFRVISPKPVQFYTNAFALVIIKIRSSICLSSHCVNNYF